MEKKGTSQPERRLLHGSFPELEEAFLRETAALRRADPLAPMVVLVPNQMLRFHLARRLATAGCPHTNILFHTLNSLAQRMAADALALEGKSPLPEFCAELALARAIQEGGALEYFAPVAAKRGFQAALLATCRDLKDAVLTPAGLERALRGLSNRDPLRPKLSDVARLWRDLESAKSARNFYDEAELLDRAAREAAGGGWMRQLARLAIYGLYDFNAAQARFLSACCDQAPTTSYFPWRDEPLFRYARPAYEWFRDRGFVPQPAVPFNSDRNPQFVFVGARHALPLQEDALPTMKSPEILLLSAPGSTSEAEEIVREIVHSEQADPHATFGILLRSTEPYRSVLTELFDGVQLKGYFHGGLPFTLRPAGHALGLLAGLLNGRLRRAEVMEFFFAAPLRPESEAAAPAHSVRRGKACLAPAEGTPTPQPPESFLGKQAGLPVEQWNYFTRRAGVVEGAEEWRRNLERLAEEMARPRPRGEDEEPRAAAPAEQASLAALRARIQRLCDGLRQSAQAHSWEEMTGAFAALFDELVDAGEDAPHARAALESLAGLDVMGIPPTSELFQQMLLDALERPVRGATRFGAAEPTVAALMEARGTTFDVVMLPGLVEGAFPSPARQDPVLLDAERLRLMEALRACGLPAELPLKGRRREEEEMLFALATQSARRRLILSFPRMDAADGRARIPSPFLLRVVESLTGKPADYRTLEEFLRTDPRGRCVGLGADASPRLRALRPLEYDLAALQEAVRAGHSEALLYLGQVSPFFMQALEAESARWGRGQFSEYDGMIRHPALLAARPIRRHDEEVVSPTRLELYARCPFEFLMRQVLRLEPLEEPERVARISPLDRGSLMHAILWEFMSETVNRIEPLTEEPCEGPNEPSHAQRQTVLSEDSWPALEAIAQRRFERFQRGGLTGFPLMWRIEQSRMLRELRRTLTRQVRESGGFRPALFEVRFGLPAGEAEESASSTSQPAQLEISPGRQARFGGRIDRIDLDPARHLSRVVDYKTGRVPQGWKDNGFACGQALQLPVYLLAAEMLLPDAPPELAEYLYLSERSEKPALRFDRESWPEKLAQLRFIVRTILDGIAHGEFFPSQPSRRCENCDYRAACGHGYRLDHKWKADIATVCNYLAMSEIE